MSAYDNAGRKRLVAVAEAADGLLGCLYDAERDVNGPDALKVLRAALAAARESHEPDGEALKRRMEQAYGDAFGVGKMPQGSKEWFERGYLAALAGKEG